MLALSGVASCANLNMWELGQAIDGLLAEKKKLAMQKDLVRASLSVSLSLHLKCYVL